MKVAIAFHQADTCVHGIDCIIENFNSRRTHALRHEGDGLETGLPDATFRIEKDRSHRFHQRVEVEGVAGKGEEGEDDEVDNVLAHPPVLVVELWGHHVDHGAGRT